MHPVGALALAQHVRDASDPLRLRQLGEHARSNLGQTVAKSRPDVGVGVFVQQLEVGRLQEVNPKSNRQVLQSEERQKLGKLTTLSPG